MMLDFKLTVCVTKNQLISVNASQFTTRGGGGGKHSFIWPKRVRVAQQGKVFRVLRLKQGIYFHYLAPLEQDVSLDWKP